MGAMKEFGQRIMTELVQRVTGGMPIHKAVTDLCEFYERTTTWDHEWIKKQVQAVADNPTSFGHTADFWHYLLRVRHHKQSRRSHMGGHGDLKIKEG